MKFITRIAILILIVLIVELLVPVVFAFDLLNNQKNSKPEIESFEEIETTYSIEEATTDKTIEQTISQKEMFSIEVSKINETTNLDWYVKYKTIKEKYNIDSKNIYNDFSDGELWLLFSVVEAEVGDYDFDSRCNVTSVIFNRLNSNEGLYSVLTSDQFTTISNGRYLEVSIDEETRLACEYVYEIGDTTNGAIFFDSTNKNSWAAYNKTFIFRDSAGHDFYR